MRVLVFGGTGFVSGAVAAEAVARGHEVTCVARGRSGDPPPGARLLRIDRDAPGALAPLAAREFDAAIDLALLSYRWVRDALAAVRTAHWTFVSSISVYADTFTPNQSVRSGRLRPAVTGDRVRYDPQRDPEPGQAVYGGVKLACEQAFAEATAGGAFVVRPGLIVGPGDDVSPFPYWPLRMSRGGRVVVPAAEPPVPAQYIDVRDLAAWLVDSMESRRSGTYDAAGPATTLAALLRGVADAVGNRVELVEVAQEELARLGVRHWTGPRSMPLWPPPSLRGAMSRDTRESLVNGLRVRPLADTAAATLRDQLTRNVSASATGLTPVEEAELLRVLS